MNNENQHCTGCGACCSALLPVTDKEIKKIRKYIKEHNIKPLKPLGLVDCPFCDISKNKEKCLIYPVRPWICKIYQCVGLRVGLFPQEPPHIVNMQMLFKPEGK